MPVLSLDEYPEVIGWNPPSETRAPIRRELREADFAIMGERTIWEMAWCCDELHYRRSDGTERWAYVLVTSAAPDGAAEQSLICDRPFRDTSALQRAFYLAQSA